MRATVVYDNFRGGEWGTLGARRARPGMFTANNMRVYRNGSIGPRPGLRDLAITGLTSGTLWSLAYVPYGGKELFVVIGTGVRLAPFSIGGASASAGTLSATPTELIRVSESTRRLNSKTYFVSYNDRVYATDLAAATTAAITTLVKGYALELYRDRLVCGGTNEQMFYSAAADFATWAALNYISVGYEYAAYHLLAHRDGLSILAQALIWRITGTIGSTDVLRRASSALAPASTSDAVLDSDTVFYIPGVRGAPITWDGGNADERSLAHLEWRAEGWTGLTAGGIARRYNDILFVESMNDKGLWRSTNVWTYHTFGVSLRGAMTRAAADKFVLATDDATPKLYVLDASLDRPGFESDTYARAGDNTAAQLAGSLSLPEHWDEQGREIRVRSVIVNFTKWNTGGSSTNHFDLTATSLDRYGGLASLASATQSFDEAGASASTTGTVQREVFNFGDQGSGGGFQISFANVRGVSIRDIAVILDVAETRAA